MLTRVPDRVAPCTTMISAIGKNVVTTTSIFLQTEIGLFGKAKVSLK